MSLNIALLKEICETPGTSGFEQRIREVILREMEPLVDEIGMDNMGNITAIKRGGSAQKVMLAAHMDELGFIVTHIDDSGFLRIHPIGGYDPKTLTAQRVIVHGKEDLIGVMGSKPIHLMKPEERGKQLQISDYFIDTGLPVEKVKELVYVGTPVTRERQLIEMGECVNCKSIDNRVSVFILIELMRELKNDLKDRSLACDLYACFTVQEEVGLRGAMAASLDIQPEFAFNIDTTIAFDTIGSAPEEQTTQLGKGVGIKIMDGTVICDYRMVNYMKELATRFKIPWQPEILTAGGTDTAYMQRMTPGGAVAGAVSIPTRYIHSVIEMAHKSDIRAAIDLLKKCVAHLDHYDWAFK